MDRLPLVLLGSARKHSDTGKFVRDVFQGMEVDLCDLLDFEIAPYNYDQHYPESDQFLQVIDRVLAHRVIVFATPVYWYAMSGSMKVFFDRLTDLVTGKKDLGRKLEGKEIFLMAVGADPLLPEGFLVPFRLTAAYLKMNFRNGIYLSVNNLPEPAHAIAVKRFTDEIASVLVK